MRPCIALGKQGRFFRFNGNHTHAVDFFFEIFPDPRQRTARTDARHKNIRFPIRLRKNFRRGRFIMHPYANGIVKLSCNHRIRRSRTKPLGIFHRSFHAFRAVGQMNFRAVGGNHFPAFFRHTIRHHNHRFHAPRLRRKRKPDPRVSRSSFNHRTAAQQLARFFRVRKHSKRHAVFYRPTGVFKLRFRKDLRGNVKLFFYLFQAQKRSISDSPLQVQRVHGTLLFNIRRALIAPSAFLRACLRRFQARSFHP